ncbi:hypothetical protein ACQ4PT_002533 [Festuca glaucescens]
MGNREVERSLVKEKGKAAPPDADDQEEDRRVLQEKLLCTRLELQKTQALCADADETICGLAAAARRMTQERDEAYMKRNALLAELQAERNAHMMMATLASGSPAATAFGCNGNRALLVPAPFGRVTTQDARAGQDSFDPDMFLLDAVEGDSVVPASGSGMAGKKKSSREVVEAPVHDKDDDDDNAS